MSTVETRMPLSRARALADEVVDLLTPVCDRIEIAGSIRRQKPDIGDLEMVAVGRITHSLGGLFEDNPVDVNHLEEEIKGMLAVGPLDPRLDKNGHKALGTAYKRLLFKGTPLDLFITTPEKWGCVYLIRTGSAEWIHKLVTTTYEDGRCPWNLKFREGRLWQFDGTEGEVLYGPDEPAGKWHVLPTPEETDVLREMGIPWIAPEQRI